MSTNSNAKILRKLKTKLTKKYHILVFLIAVLIGIITRFVFLTSYTQFDGEQARSGFILMEMWQGKIPTLGAPSSVGGFGILPYYYYWTFLWTIFGPNPIWQAMSNTFPSFLLIPLIFITIYKLLHSNFLSLKQIWQDFQNNTNSKLLIAAFGSLFYSIFFTEIFYSQMEWNPNAGTFWLILLALSLEKLWNLEWQIKKLTIFEANILQRKTHLEQNSAKDLTTNSKLTTNSDLVLKNSKEQVNSDKKPEEKEKNWNQKLSGKFNTKFVKKIFSLSILIGILVNVLLSLHSSFLFTTPVFCVFFGLFWLFKKKSVFILNLNFASIWFFSLPYWIGEFGRNFGNTTNLFITLTKSTSGQNPFQKLDRLLFSGLEIGKLAYFPENNLYLFSHIFLTILLILTVLFYAKIQSILLNLLVTFWLIFVLISSNFGGILHVHYLVIVWSFPCLLTAILFHFLLDLKANLKVNHSNFADSFKSLFGKNSLNCIIIFLLFGILLSFGVNISKVYVYATIKFGDKRLTNTQDMIAIMTILPRESQICLINPERKNSLDYLNQFVVKRDQKITICDQNSLKNLKNLQKINSNQQINSQNTENQNSEHINSKNLTFPNNSTNNSTNTQNLKIFIFWEKYNGLEMNLAKKPIWLEKLQIKQKIGNIEVLETD